MEICQTDLPTYLPQQRAVLRVPKKGGNEGHSPWEGAYLALIAAPRRRRGRGRPPGPPAARAAAAALRAITLQYTKLFRRSFLYSLEYHAFCGAARRP